MLSACFYDKAIDIWAIGCILAELMNKKGERILFRGNNYLQMLELMFGCLGAPTDEDLKAIQNPKVCI
jgi:mitogen-activated protein kinase 1/3